MVLGGVRWLWVAEESLPHRHIHFNVRLFLVLNEVNMQSKPVSDAIPMPPAVEPKIGSPSSSRL